MLFRSVAIPLCLFMLIRHYFFYSSLDYIGTEYGYDQSFFALLLVPVTASFGIYSSFSSFQKVVFSSDFRAEFLKSLRIFLKINFVYVLVNLDRAFIDLISFGALDVEDKPRFLILLPISIFILVSPFFSNLRILCLVLLCCFGLYLFNTNFILHYFIIFCLSRLAVTSSLLQQFISGGWKVGVVPFLIYGLCTFVVLGFQIERVGVFFEFVWSFFYFVSLLRITYIVFNFLPNCSFRVSILSFYISQSLGFTGMVFFRPYVWEGYLMLYEFFITFLIAIVSFYISNRVKLL